jgi:hypothetical protein
MHSSHINESIIQAKLRYRVCVIALQCDHDTLNSRLKHRVETMLTVTSLSFSSFLFIFHTIRFFLLILFLSNVNLSAAGLN